jgi:hypothetical protein
MAEQRLGADGPQHTLFWPFVGLFPVGRRSSPALAAYGDAKEVLHVNEGWGGKSCTDGRS